MATIEDIEARLDKLTTESEETAGELEDAVKRLYSRARELQAERKRVVKDLENQRQALEQNEIQLRKLTAENQFKVETLQKQKEEHEKTISDLQGAKRSIEAQLETIMTHINTLGETQKRIKSFVPAIDNILRESVANDAPLYRVTDGIANETGPFDDGAYTDEEEGDGSPVAKRTRSNLSALGLRL